MVEKTEADNDKVFSLLYDVAIRVLDKQIEAVDGLDRNVRGVSAFTLLVLGTPITFLSSQYDKFSRISKTLFFFDAAVLISVIAFIFLSSSYTKQRYLFGGRPLADITKMKVETQGLRNSLLLLTISLYVLLHTGQPTPVTPT